MRRNYFLRLTLATLALAGIVTGCSKLDGSGASSARNSPAHDSATAQAARIDTAITVTATGYGPLRIGMTVASAATALGSPAPSTAGLDTACSYVHVANEPAGMRIMVVRDTVVRIEIDSSAIATGLGARIGDPESRIKELYGSRVTVQPHKYLPNGHYLIVNPIPASDTGLKLIFETDGNRVTKYRVGRVPEVQLVEGCA